jgi:hypothetical protein
VLSNPRLAYRDRIRMWIRMRTTRRHTRVRCRSGQIVDNPHFLQPGFSPHRAESSAILFPRFGRAFTQDELMTTAPRFEHQCA